MDVFQCSAIDESLVPVLVSTAWDLILSNFQFMNFENTLGQKGYILQVFVTQNYFSLIFIYQSSTTKFLDYVPIQCSSFNHYSC